jgi:hypothetical protein
MIWVRNGQHRVSEPEGIGSASPPSGDEVNFALGLFAGIVIGSLGTLLLEALVWVLWRLV